MDSWCERGLCSVLLFCRSSPHPYITALENRVDCWPALLLEIDDFIQQAADRLARLHQRPWTLHPIIPSVSAWILKPSVTSVPCQITHHTTVSCYYAILTNTDIHTVHTQHSDDDFLYTAAAWGSFCFTPVWVVLNFDISQPYVKEVQQLIGTLCVYVLQKWTSLRHHAGPLPAVPVLWTSEATPARPPATRSPQGAAAHTSRSWISPPEEGPGTDLPSVRQPAAVPLPAGATHAGDKLKKEE